MSETNHPITLSTLLDRCQRVVIPQIQRDYAQGRDSEKEVRNAFLNALHAALVLPPGHARLPLNLDFIYGSMEGRDDQSFLPLDGQQRLTTLFLLHWYLAWRDERLTDFRGILWADGHSRFSYDVRPSSGEFFDELVQFSPPANPQLVSSVRTLLEDQPWFFLYWRLDPTIQSALTMLDGIHARFRNSTGLYARLVDQNQPAITFQLLPLEHFGLSDDLYIKMNARGKPLTPFETFKARFEELLKTLFVTECRKIDEAEFPIPQFFERRMDTQWTEFFWHHKNKTTHTFDDAVMNLLWALIRISLDPQGSLFADHTALLRTGAIHAGYTAFHDRGWLTRELADNLICLLEAWSAGGSPLKLQLPNTRYFDEAKFFQKAIATPASLEYSELAIFAAFVAYLRVHEGSVDPSEFQEWMRVVFNLVENSNVQRPEEYGRSLAGLQKLVPHARQILQHLAESKAEQQGFSSQQVREEVLKAKLILAHPGWRSRMDRAEAHGYFRGQIEFLLEFSEVIQNFAAAPVSDWPETLHTQLQGRFDDYLAKAEKTFGPSGLIPLPGDAHHWQRALLTVGDYLIEGTSNFSFATSPASNWDSWKRFLRGSVDGDSPKRRLLKTLWDGLDLNAPLKPQLEHRIRESTGLEPWRAAIVGHPQVIDYCEQREIRKRAGVQEVYLLKKTQMNGAHAELFSYALYHDLATPAARAKLAPLRLLDYQSVTMTEIEPYFRLAFEHSKGSATFSVESIGGRFRIAANLGSLAALGADTVLKDKLGFTPARFVSRAEILDVLQQLASVLTNLLSTDSAKPA
jgi:hypothetical protein